MGHVESEGWGAHSFSGGFGLAFLGGDAVLATGQDYCRKQRGVAGFEAAYGAAVFRGRSCLRPANMDHLLQYLHHR